LMIALPNPGGNFTCTLFMPFEGEVSLEKLNNKEAVMSFFETYFPDVLSLMPNLVDDFLNNPTGNLATMRCYPWVKNKVALMGDSAHAIVPFYGQGMNAGFEDCTVLSNLMKKHNENWEAIFEEYSRERKPDGDALQDLSLDNYYVMRDYVSDPEFLLRKKIEAKFSVLYPKKWLPLYSQVTFSNIRYSVAYQQGKKQSDIMDIIMQIPNIENVWDSETVMNEMKVLSKDFNF